MTTTPRAEIIARAGRGTTSERSHAEPARWDDVAQRLRAGSATTWLTVRSTAGGAHTRPVFAAWGGESFFFATNPTAAKTRHLRHDPDVSLAIDLGTAHLVAEGTAARLTTPDGLDRASTAMHEVFDWPTTPVGGLLDAPYAAPTSGGPPFEAWEVVPERAHAFPTEDQFEPTRFRFDDR